MTQTQTNSSTASYRDTYYTRTMEPSLDAAPLTDRIEAEVCIIGGGIAGISCAYELIKAGRAVVLLEADQIAWGASGRNGGVVGPGFAADGAAIEKKLGMKTAKQIFDLSQEGVDIFRSYTETLALPGVDMRPGSLSVTRYRDAQAMQDYIRHKADAYGYQLDYISTEKLREMVRTDRYFDGVYDPQGFHAHSLNYCLGLARETQRLGGRFFENTRAVSMSRHGAGHLITTPAGSIQCQNIILCQGGMVDGFHKRLQRNLLPIGTFVTVTEPLGDLADEIINTTAAIVDTRMACDYFRITPDRRLLWGGGMTGMALEPANLEQQMRRAFTSVFPQLADVKIDATWSGLLGYARHRMPYVCELHDGVWAATGLGGHGINVGPIVGRLIAEALVENGQRHKVLDSYGLTWNGSMFGPLAADTVYYWEALKERYFEWRYR